MATGCGASGVDQRLELLEAVLVRGERGRELEQQRAELAGLRSAAPARRASRAAMLAPPCRTSSDDAAAAGPVADVLAQRRAAATPACAAVARQQAVQLDVEREAVPGVSLRPARDLARGRDGVERGVDLDRVEALRVVRQPVARRQARRVPLRDESPGPTSSCTCRPGSIRRPSGHVYPDRVAIDGSGAADARGWTWFCSSPADARALAAGTNRDGHPWAAGYPLGSSLLGAELTVAAAAQKRPLGAFGSYQLVRRADGQRDRRRRLPRPARRHRRRVSIGCAIADDARGQGYATEAARRPCSDWARHQTGLDLRAWPTRRAPTSPPSACSSAPGCAAIGEDGELLYYMLYGTEIFYKDWGTGQPVVFSHGWPLNADAWDDRAKFVADNGFRAIAHDRRGHGRSSQPWDGNDMDTYADDLAELIEALDLHDVVLVGHSTGGGEVARYIGRHGTGRVAKAVLAGRRPAAHAQDRRQPRTACRSRPSTTSAPASLADRSQFYQDLTRPFYGANRDGSTVSQGVRDDFWRKSMQVGLKGAYDCIKAFSETDLTEDLKTIDVPTLIVHGDDDQIVPIVASAMKSSELVKDGTLKVYPGAPHGISTRYQDEFNADLLAFIEG